VQQTTGLLLQSASRSTQQKGFKVIPRRWVVERTFLASSISSQQGLLFVLANNQRDDDLCGNDSFNAQEELTRRQQSCLSCLDFSDSFWVLEQPLAGFNNNRTVGAQRLFVASKVWAVNRSEAHYQSFRRLLNALRHLRFGQVLLVCSNGATQNVLNALHLRFGPQEFF